jgi:hypothetical protein
VLRLGICRLLRDRIQSGVLRCRCHSIRLAVTFHRSRSLRSRT